MIITAVSIMCKLTKCKKEDVQYWQGRIEAKLFGILWLLSMSRIIRSTLLSGWTRFRLGGSSLAWPDPFLHFCYCTMILGQ